MAKVRAGEDGSDYLHVVNFKPESIAAAPADVYAVYDEGDGEWAVFPVVLFALGTLSLGSSRKGKHKDVPNAVCGMVSNLGGLVIVEHAADMKFIGYWKKETQSLQEFLEDHEVEVGPDFEDDEDEGD